MAQSLTVVLIVFIGAVYLFIAYTDFTRWKIGNLPVLILLALGFAGHAAAGFEALLSGVIAALILFILNYAFWLAKMTSGGDVKLLTVTGFIVGLDRALEFAMLLLAFSVLLLLVTALARRLAFVPSAVRSRFAEIRDRGQVPYGVPISLSALCLLATQLPGW